MSCGDPICRHGRYATLCLICSGNFPDYDWPPLPWPSFSAFASPYGNFSGPSTENFVLSNQVKDLEDRLNKMQEDLEQYKRMLTSRHKFHNCQVRPGEIQPYHQLLCSLCHQPQNDASFDPIDEIKRLREEKQVLFDTISEIRKVVATKDTTDAKDRSEILRLCTKNR